MILPDRDDPTSYTPPHCFMFATPDPLGKRSKQQRYHELNSSNSLAQVLRGKHCVEFPIIDIFEEGSFHGTIVDESGAIESIVEERPAKRRKLDRKAISGLVGGYGSGDEELAAEEEPRALHMLGEYAASDVDEAEGIDDPREERNGVGEHIKELEEDALEGSDDDLPDINGPALLELLKHAQALNKGPLEIDDEEEIDEHGYNSDEGGQ